MGPRLCLRRRFGCLAAMVTASILLLQAFPLLRVLFVPPQNLIIKHSEDQDIARFHLDPQILHPAANCCSSSQPQIPQQRRPGHVADGSFGNHTSHPSIQLGSAAELTGISAGAKNASVGLTNVSVGVANASVGVHNAWDSQDRQQASRQALVRSVCSSQGPQIPGQVQKVYVYEARKVAYCSTHKVASTYWIRVYRWLYNDTRWGHVASPLNISKLDTHLLPLRKLRVRNLTKRAAEDLALTDASYRFLFTRDPYARLWSVYIDKFVLPDNYFWSYYAPQIKNAVREDSIKQTHHHALSPSRARVQTNDSMPWWNRLRSIQEQDERRTNSVRGRDLKGEAIHSVHGRDLKGDAINSIRGRDLEGEAVNSVHGRDLKGDAIHSFRGRDLRSAAILPGHVQGQSRPALSGKAACPEEVTFREFLQYIVHRAAKKGGQALDDHFRPVHYGCHPCHFRPHFLGHMETMGPDSQHVLRQMKLDRLLPELGADHVQLEVDTLISFNFDLVVKHKLQRRCVSDVDLETRLLRAFVYNGYLTPEDARWLEGRLPLSMAAFREAVLSLHRSSSSPGKKSSDDLKRQKERFKWEAFRQMPKDLLLAVQAVFRWDFELFGYDPSPPELFGTV